MYYLSSSPGWSSGKLDKVVIAHGSVQFCEATPIGLIVDESKESLYERETDRDLRASA